MMQNPWSKIKNLKFTLRFCVVFILIAFFVAALSIILPLFYTQLARDIAQVSFHSMRQVTSDVVYRIDDELDNIEIAGRFSKELLKTNVVAPQDQSEFIDYLYSLMNIEAGTFESVQSVSWGDEQGNFIKAEKNINGTVTLDIINRTINPHKRILIYRDINGNILNTVNSQDFSYDHRLRPWYTAAKNAKKPIWTEIYGHHDTGILGATYATPYYKKAKFLGVFALNVRLDYLSRFLKNTGITAHSIVYLIEDDEKIIAFPGTQQQTHLMDISEIKLPWIIGTYKYFKKTAKNEFSYHYNHNNYLAMYTPIHKFGNHQVYVGIVVPETDFIGNTRDMDVLTIWLSVFILMFGFVVVYLFLIKVMAPIKALIEETENIKNFELDNKKIIRSKIKEMSLLSNAIESMKNGLRSFRKYVPASLVRQLIKTGEDVRMGGVKKHLAIFFSDIEHFTQIAEREDPSLLTLYLCEYFEALTEIIVTERGTIDKYIGDSIMAMWGAPLSDSDSCQRAAKAALACQKKITRLNQRWMHENRPVFITRIGLHTGDAIVGNVGSSERLSYTAIGDAINVASRLESLNKRYGTHILVSDDFYKVVKDQFVLRLVDHVILEGKEEPGYVYELLAKEVSECSFDVNAYRKSFEKGFTAYQNQEWAQAMTYFQECKIIYPNDTVANVFIKRCKPFQKKS